MNIVINNSLIKFGGYIMKKTEENENNLRDGFYIPIDRKLYETSEEVYRTYYSMDRRERYLEERSRKKELSYETLLDEDYPIEEKMASQTISVEDEAITAVMIERMLRALTILSDEEKWLIQELFFYGKSEREIAMETGMARTSIQYKKGKVIEKLKRDMKIS